MARSLSGRVPLSETVEIARGQRQPRSPGRIRAGAATGWAPSTRGNAARLAASGTMADSVHGTIMVGGLGKGNQRAGLGLLQQGA